MSLAWEMMMALAFAVGPLTNPPRTTLTLAWDASPSPDIVSYELFWGTNSRSYPLSVVCGSNLTCVWTNALLYQTNYWAVVAKDKWNLHSDYSPELAYMPLPKTNVIIDVNTPYGSEVTQDFIVWTYWPSTHATITNPAAPCMFWRGDEVTVTRRYQSYL